MDTSIHKKTSCWGIGIALLAPAALLLPFVDKAFTVDDTVYIWVARQILVHPADFFGFSKVWDSLREVPMYDINRNPPGVSYVIAALMTVFGESERYLHLFFIVPAMAVSAGTYGLARQCHARPLPAALCAVFTPVFAVSSSNIMSDTLMVAFYVWAAVAWNHGLDKNRCAPLLGSAVLISCSALTKYYGVTLAPLLLVYTLLRTRRFEWRLLVLGLPLAVLAAYEVYTWRLYGKGMLGEAASFASQEKWHPGYVSLLKIIHGLGFAGGCYSIVLFFTPFLISRRVWVSTLLVSLAGIGVYNAVYPDERLFVVQNHTVQWLYVAQWAIFVSAGIIIIIVAARDIRDRRDAISLFLALWVAGALVFSLFINWSITARTLLPMAPALSILLVRRLEILGRLTAWKLACPLAAAACSTLLVMHGDYAWANSQREAAALFPAKLGKAPEEVYYMGHWGFQYYMEKWGAKPVTDAPIKQDSLVVLPRNNCFSFIPDARTSEHLMTLKLPLNSWVCTMQSLGGAGFYSDHFGPLPFALGRVPEEEYRIYRVDLHNRRDYGPAN